MKAILTLVFWAAVTAALAQTVSFRNYDLYTTTAERRVFEFDSRTPVVGTHIAVQLLYGTSASSLTPHTQTATFRNVPTSDTFAGTWTGGTRTLTGMAPGQTAILQVRAWDSTGGVTFDQALCRSISMTFSYLIPSPGAPPSAYFMEGFRSFTYCPEPSSIGLALIGAAALLFLGRRKRRS
jgi:hypothetical protein